MDDNINIKSTPNIENPQLDVHSAYHERILRNEPEVPKISIRLKVAIFISRANKKIAPFFLLWVVSGALSAAYWIYSNKDNLPTDGYFSSMPLIIQILILGIPISVLLTLTLSVIYLFVNRLSNQYLDEIAYNSTDPLNPNSIYYNNNDSSETY
jgi:hypothetical protein